MLRYDFRASALLAPIRLQAVLGSALVGVGLIGCSAVVNPDSDRLGPDLRVDSGTVTLMDSGSRDAGPGFDAGDGPCTEGTSRCAGDTLFACIGGMEVPRDCQAMGAFCEAGQCEPHVCTPNRRECSGGEAAVLSCSARGDQVSREGCPNGCDPMLIACRSEGPACAGIDTIEVDSSHRVNLCESFDANTNMRAEGCGSSMRAAVQDIIFRLQIDRRQTVLIELTDVDSARAIDTLVYIRRTCDDAGSQIACGDDVPCDESTAEPPACWGDMDRRQSRISITLDPGTYYIVVDGYRYARDTVSFGCGEVELSVELDGPFPFP